VYYRKGEYTEKWPGGSAGGGGCCEEREKQVDPRGKGCSVMCPMDEKNVPARFLRRAESHQGARNRKRGVVYQDDYLEEKEKSCQKSSKPRFPDKGGGRNTKSVDD